LTARTPLRARALLVAAVVVSAAGVLSTSATAATAAPTPCWRTLITDWSDGHIDGRYPVSCYRSAIANTPTDLRIYSSIDDDLGTALRVRIARLSAASARRRTLAVVASQQRTAAPSMSTSVRLVALLAVLGGTLAAAWLGVVLARRRRVQATRLRSRR